MPNDSRPPRPASASAPRGAHGHGADFNTRNSLLALGVPPNAAWVRLRSAPFVAGRQTALITVDGAVCQTFQWAPDSEQRDAWVGHALEIIGVLNDGTPHPRYAPLVGEYGPFWLLSGDDGSELYVQVWRYSVLLSGTPLSVQLTIGHGTGQRRRGSIEGLELEHKPADTRRAARAGALLWRLEKAGSGGQLPLEQKTDHPWRIVAEAAEDMARDNPQLSDSIIAWKLKVPGPTEDAKTRKLRRWRALRRKLLGEG